ncbi:WD40-repeat-containing domain protein [Cubamyces menziesii]|nr:WD40-repeat-containing domain protein [Cubamyces menziesii]
MALSADGPAHRAVGHGAAANSNEPEDVTIDLPHNDYNPEAEIIDMLEDPGTTLDVERDVVIDKPYNKAVRWGCWSVLSSPPKIRSGTLVLSLSAPNSESSRETPEPLLASREYSVLDVSHSPPSPSIAQSVSLRDVSNVDADEEESRTTGRHNQARVVQLRKDTHDKPRRLLALPDSRGQLSVTMRGSLDLLEGPHSRHVLELMASPPTEASRQAVDDACILSSFEAPVVVLGHARNSKQLSLVRLEGRRGKVMGTFDRPAQSEKNGGISAVCVMMQPGMFATGGYDHAVHLWSLPSNGPPTPSGPLAIKHTSVVQSLLAIRDTSRKLVTASADCSVNLFDLPSERVVNCLKLSNSVYQVHPGPSEFCTLLEVAHRELQFEVRDYRLVPIAPVVRFGYRSSKVHGRYVRGAVENHLFASGGGEKDGCVRLWDLRKPSEILQTVPCLPGRKVIQVLFGNEQLVACAEDHHLAFMNRIGDLVAETGNL